MRSNRFDDRSPNVGGGAPRLGDSFTAEEASAWGFVNVLTEPGEALAGALALAERITKNGPLAVAVTTAQMEDFAQVMRELWHGEVVIGHDGPIGKYQVLVLDPDFNDVIPHTYFYAGDVGAQRQDRQGCR